MPSGMKGKTGLSEGVNLGDTRGGFAPNDEPVLTLVGDPYDPSEALGENRSLETMTARPGIACGDPGLSVLDLDHQVFAALLPQVMRSAATTSSSITSSTIGSPSRLASFGRASHRGVDLINQARGLQHRELDLGEHPGRFQQQSATVQLGDLERALPGTECRPPPAVSDHQ